MNFLDALHAPVSEEFIGHGDQAIYTTVNRMRGIINSSAANPYVRRWAQKALESVMVQDKWGEAQALHDFVRDNIRYTNDPRGIEFVQTPPILLEGIRYYLDGRQSDRPIGDCDDMTTLALSLMKSVGFDTAIKVVSFDPEGRYSHVYGLVRVNGDWYATDTVRPDRHLGWEASGITRAMEVRI